VLAHEDVGIDKETRSAYPPWRWTMWISGVKREECGGEEACYDGSLKARSSGSWRKGGLGYFCVSQVVAGTCRKAVAVGTSVGWSAKPRYKNSPWVPLDFPSCISI